MDAAAQLSALRGVYHDYLEAYRQRVVDNGPLHSLHKFLLGNSTTADRKADTAFYKAAAEAVKGLENADPSTAGQAVRLMILEAEGPDSTSGLMIEAAQALATPLLPLLEGEDAAGILAAYRARYPKKRMLSPKQRELLAALEQAAK